ncbi:diaminopimelate epimerase [Buchnera aphidicola (Cinara tujafilina)]|uniref:Diaminopimelate epimerase n=1 Tax=Buchnera aphidicola (Cinara tujafilina) TaxID=261317 RepID=F7WZS1_9GAMM|nr:diaminopimelate epimerase [Buchnera aphidicola]AEH39947.1 diaminopimelate epimerase [Buchnera aphidicola (Cinara tujafilina)]
MTIKKNIVRFSKMHGLGNDFMLVDNIENNFFFSSQLVKKWSNRYQGVGFDQLLIIQNKKFSEADFHYCIINSDGTEAEQCGNGARCIAYYLFIIKNKKNKICISTKNRYLYLEYLYKNFMKINMGCPIFSPSKIPFLYHKIKFYYDIKIDNINYKISVVSMGNPHCVILVNNINDNLIQKIGYQVATHPLFPEGVNVGFMQIISKNKILLRVYERGVGETKSCGTGACAAAVIGIRNNLLCNSVTVFLSGGQLEIIWKGGLNDNVYMSGEAVHVYDGILKY